MFGKLMKYEWRATAPTQGLLALASLGISILAGIVLRLLVDYGDTLPEILVAGMGFSLFFMFLGIMVCMVAANILLIVRFYKHKFTDEGYLTFTLPVNSHQIFLSAGLNHMIWMLISGLVLFLGFIVIVLVCLIGQPLELPPDFFDELHYVLQQAIPESASGYMTVMILQLIVALPYSAIMTMTCITVGASIAKKHKILAAIGIYYAISWITGVVSGVLSVIMSISNMDSMLGTSVELYEEQVFASMTVSMTVILVWQLILMVGGYLLSTHLMSKKLNLP